MLIMVLMLMRCLQNSGFDRRYMAEAAWAMRDLMSREEEPSFVIRDPVKESTNCTSMLYFQWQMVGGVRRWLSNIPATLAAVKATIHFCA